MKLSFRFFGVRRNSWEGEKYAQDTAALLYKSSEFEIVDDPDKADKICLVESNQFKTDAYLKEILKDPLIRSRANDCFCINYEDDALGILPGLYAGLPKCRFDPQRHLASCYLKPPTPDDRTRASWLDGHRDRQPKYLISFRGAMSHPVRRRLLAMADSVSQLGPIQHVDRWFDHTQDEKLAYWNEVIDTKFVLCPRGISPASIRLFEVMEMGRVPVIVSDQWVSPPGIDWEACSIQIAEKDVERISETVSSHAGRWAAMANAAQSIWQQNFSPNARLEFALRQWFERSRQRGSRYSELDELKKFRHGLRRWKVGWALPQRIAYKLHRQLNRLRIAVNN